MTARSTKAGVTLVELMVCTTLALLLFISIVPMFIKAGRYESNLGLQAAARTALAVDLERITRGIELASSFDDSSMEFHFPSECGGVSVETNRIVGLVALSLSNDDEAVDVSLSLRERFASAVKSENRRIAADPVVYGGGVARYEISGFSITNVVSLPGVVCMTLEASVPQKDSFGNTSFKAISVSRLARLWNR